MPTTRMSPWLRRVARTSEWNESTPAKRLLHLQRALLLHRATIEMTFMAYTYVQDDDKMWQALCEDRPLDNLLLCLIHMTVSITTNHAPLFGNSIKAYEITSGILIDHIDIHDFYNNIFLRHVSELCDILHRGVGSAMLQPVTHVATIRNSLPDNAAQISRGVEERCPPDRLHIISLPDDILFTIILRAADNNLRNVNRYLSSTATSLWAAVKIVQTKWREFVFRKKTRFICKLQNDIWLDDLRDAAYDIYASGHITKSDDAMYMIIAATLSYIANEHINTMVMNTCLNGGSFHCWVTPERMFRPLTALFAVYHHNLETRRQLSSCLFAEELENIWKKIFHPARLKQCTSGWLHWNGFRCMSCEFPEQYSHVHYNTYGHMHFGPCSCERRMRDRA